MVVEIAIITSIFGTSFVRALVKKAVNDFEQEFDSNQLCYKLKRNAIICPRCSSVHITATFEEQMNDKWECPVCSCKWFETLSHDIIKE